MTSYIIHGRYFNGDIKVVFDFEGRVKTIDFVCEIDDEKQKQFLKSIPIQQADFLAWIKNSQIKFSIIPADLSFEAFWTAYQYKVGNKNRAEKLWQTLSEEEKCKVFVSLPKYGFYLQMHPKLERLYPETFLFQRRFENEYK